VIIRSRPFAWFSPAVLWWKPGPKMTQLAPGATVGASTSTLIRGKRCRDRCPEVCGKGDIGTSTSSASARSLRSSTSYAQDRKSAAILTEEVDFKGKRARKSKERRPARRKIGGNRFISRLAPPFFSVWKALQLALSGDRGQWPATRGLFERRFQRSHFSSRGAATGPGLRQRKNAPVRISDAPPRYPLGARCVAQDHTIPGQPVERPTGHSVRAGRRTGEPCNIARILSPLQDATPTTQSGLRIVSTRGNYTVTSGDTQTGLVVIHPNWRNPPI